MRQPSDTAQGNILVSEAPRALREEGDPPLKPLQVLSVGVTLPTEPPSVWTQALCLGAGSAPTPVGNPSDSSMVWDVSHVSS